MRFDLIAVKVFPSGAWLISTIYNNVRYQQQYIGYTKREALRLFREYMRK